MKASLPTKNFNDLPDIITYKDYADYTGVGINKAREKFNSKGFPLMKGFGNKKKANKYQVFLFDIQDVSLKEVFAKQFAEKLIGG